MPAGSCLRPTVSPVRVWWKVVLTAEVHGIMAVQNHFDYRVDFTDLVVAYSLVKPTKLVDEEKARETVWRKSVDVHSMSFFTDPAGAPLPSLDLRKHAIKLAYPGAWKGIQSMLAENILDGRFQLATKYDGKRARLQAVDGNFIDTMYVDKRLQREEKNRGNTLVVCCDGNSAFYEIGYMFVAIEAGYSTLGWNPPGFACSTGLPCPEQMRNAVDVVMKYALNVLQFEESDIMLFAYSIGGYPAAWAATKYPRIKGLVLDACFDELLPLVQLHLRGGLGSMMSMVLKDQEYNLGIARLLRHYHGPVALFRRDRDEIIGRRVDNKYINNTNRLLRLLLIYRYPAIVNEETLPVLNEWLDCYERHSQGLWLRYYDKTCPNCPDTFEAIHKEFFLEGEDHFPFLFGRYWDLHVREHITIYLADKYLKTVSGTHNSVLPVELLVPPWKH